jgi:hypothetical protein
MYLIHKSTNTLSKISKKPFSEIGFKERTHLQEWIANNSECLGEPLLIIQKEFAGFSETNERLDLMALDKKGNLVVIENKLDDSGRDVTWQALKYASYCSTLTKDEVRTIFQSYLNSIGSGKNALEVLEDFFGGQTYDDLIINQGFSQRVFLVAANFRKEVTSTVMWLNNFKLQVYCFKASLHCWEDQNFLTLEQIIPVKDAQDYIISMTNKVQEDLNTDQDLQNRHKVRLEFWAQLLKEIKGKSSLFQNSNPTKDHWLVAGGTNISSLSFQFIITMSSATVLLNFGRANTDENKTLFDELYKSKLEIEAKFGNTLNWERLNERKSSKVSFTLPGVNYFTKEDWQKIIAFLIENINRLEIAVNPYFPKLKNSLNMTEVELLNEENN